MCGTTAATNSVIEIALSTRSFSCEWHIAHRSHWHTSSSGSGCRLSLMDFNRISVQGTCTMTQIRWTPSTYDKAFGFSHDGGVLYSCIVRLRPDTGISGTRCAHQNPKLIGLGVRPFLRDSQILREKCKLRIWAKMDGWSSRTEMNETYHRSNHNVGVRSTIRWKLTSCK